mmetsp:Transcript_13481/g.26500  ORF Transcript_13481/g.26500 Transcript_13481/m.26500 type:complete len:706 (+) Transcript_13481:20-2137(+)
MGPSRERSNMEMPQTGHRSDLKTWNASCGHMWTYEEVMAHQKAKLRRPPTENVNWPVNRPDIQPDPGRWAPWLPSDWIQVRRVTDVGIQKPAWISPEGSVYERKDQIEKRLGVTFEKDGRHLEGGFRHFPIMTYADANGCPDYWPSQLPQDWRICLRSKNGKVSVCYYPPGDDENYVGTLADVKRSMSFRALPWQDHGPRPTVLPKPSAKPRRSGPSGRSGRRKPKSVPLIAIQTVEKRVEKRKKERNDAIEVSDDEPVQTAARSSKEDSRQNAAASAVQSGKARRVCQPGHSSLSCRVEVLSKPTFPEFFQFLQCQLRMEALVTLNTEVAFEDADAQRLWCEYHTFLAPLRLRGAEFLVPYHAILGKHELFLFKTVHHQPFAKWDARQRIVATLVFRAHCNQELFTTAQLPHLLGSEFWSDPLGAFSVGRALELSMLEFHQSQQPKGGRSKTGVPDDVPLEGPLSQVKEDIVDNAPRSDKRTGTPMVGRLGAVRRITARTQRLLRVADLIWPLLAHAEQDASATLLRIETLIEEVDGLGKNCGTMVAKDLDLARPELGLLEAREEIDVEALVVARCLIEGLEGQGHNDAQGRELLLKVLKTANSFKTGSGKHFWDLLQQVEDAGQRALYDMPLALSELKTPRFQMSAATLQVQLCQYRRFRQSLAHTRLGLGGDVAMALPAAAIGWRKYKSAECCKRWRSNALL